MATAAQIANFQLRQLNLPATITDATIGLYLDDAALEFPRFGISETDDAYEKMLYLYASHLMVIGGIIPDLVTSESVKDVSASYAGSLQPGESTGYYSEFMKTLRRRKYPLYVLHNS